MREDVNRQRSLLANAWKVLNDRERHIICERRLKDEPASLEDLALHYGISRERVRQIEMRAMQKLQKAARQQAIPMAAKAPAVHADTVILGRGSGNSSRLCPEPNPAGQLFPVDVIHRPDGYRQMEP